MEVKTSSVLVTTASSQVLNSDVRLWLLYQTAGRQCWGCPRVQWTALLWAPATSRRGGSGLGPSTFSVLRTRSWLFIRSFCFYDVLVFYCGKCRTRAGMKQCHELCASLQQLLPSPFCVIFYAHGIIWSPSSGLFLTKKTFARSLDRYCQQERTEAQGQGRPLWSGWALRLKLRDAAGAPLPVCVSAGSQLLSGVGFHLSRSGLLVSHPQASRTRHSSFPTPPAVQSVPWSAGSQVGAAESIHCVFLCTLAQVGFRGFQIAAEKQNDAVSLHYEGRDYQLSHGSVVIAAVTSCTNNCNPSVMLAAGGWWRKAARHPSLRCLSLSVNSA